MREFDVVVVSGGTAGIAAALAARSAGARVALVEREGRLGGDCTFYGCVPSKGAATSVDDDRRGERRPAADHAFDAAPFACSASALRIVLARARIQRLMKQALLALVAALVVASCGANGSNPPARAGSSVPRFDLSTEHGRAVLDGFDPRYLVAGASRRS